MVDDLHRWQKNMPVLKPSSMEKLKIFFFVLRVFVLFVKVKAIRRSPDRIRNWFGQPHGHSFQQYGGFVEIDSTTGKSFYYIFIEAENDPKNKPLVLWLNGGPGCSSVWAGLLTEHGPWRVAGPNSSQLRYNQFSWNKVANIIYLESPTGVGFSYSNSSDDYIINDNITASDNYAFLAGWMKKFPQFQKNSFFIAGESYAGHYIPQLASEILNRDKRPSNYSCFVKLNFKGIFIGGPYLREFDDSYIVKLFYSRYLISSSLYKGYLKWCFNGYSIECLGIQSQISNSIGLVDKYDLNSPICTSSGNSEVFKKTRLEKVNSASQFWTIYEGLKRNKTISTSENDKEKAPPTVPKPFSVGNPFCSDIWIFRYMNKVENQRRINARLGGKYKEQFYLPCRGDADAVVPFSVTRDDVDTLNLRLTRPYHIWYYFDQPGGWVEEYAGLTMFTIRDAGHLFPVRQPERALYVFKKFLAGQRLKEAPFSFDSSQ